MKATKQSLQKGLLILIIFALTHFSWATSLPIISGKVTSTVSEIVSYATVHLKGTTMGCMTDDNGCFSIQAPAGDYTIVVSMLGFETVEQQISLINGEESNLNITIEEKTSLLNEVVIIGNNEANLLKKKGFTVNMVSGGSLNLQSVQATELLDKTAGVRIRQSGGVGSKIDYNINGLSGNSVRVFINGISIRNYGSSFSLSSIPSEQIERIEVYKGVVPAHLSEDALGGAINVILKQNVSSNNLRASYSYGSFNTQQMSVDGSYKEEKSGLTFDGSVYYNTSDNDFKVWGDQVYITDVDTWKLNYIKAKRFHDGYESYGLRGNIGFTDVKWADSFMVGLLYSDMNKDVQNGGTMEVVYGNRRTGQQTKMASLKYDKKNFLLDNLDVYSVASYTHSNRWVVDTIPDMYYWNGERLWNEDQQSYYKWNRGGGEAGIATLADNLEKSVAYRMNVSYTPHPQHQIHVNYFYNHFSRDINDPLLPQAEQALTDTRNMAKHIWGGTYENEWMNGRLKSFVFFKHYMQNVSLADPVKTGNTYQVTQVDRTVNHNGYGAGIAYKLFPKVLLQSSYEHALRLPESNELLGNKSENINATYQLEPEKSHNINLGLLLGTFIWKKHSMKGDINFFVRNIFDMIQRGETSTDGYYGYENLGKVLSKGFDAEYNYEYDNKLFLTYGISMFNARFNLRYNENGAEYSYYKDRLRNAPYFTMNTGVEYVLTNVLQRDSRLRLNYQFAYVHKFYKNWESIGGENKATIPTQDVHNLGMIYTFPNKRVSVGLNAKNILNKQIFDNWALQKPGRSFHAKISYRIL